MTNTEPKYPNITVELIGLDSNAMVLISAVSRELRRGRVSGEEIAQFRNEAMSGDYDNVLTTIQRWVEVV